LSIQRSLERMQRGERQDGFAKADAAHAGNTTS
jgi:hypothetical protein